MPTRRPITSPQEWSSLRPAGTVPRILTRDQALALGFTRRAIEHRLATGRWFRVLPGVYLTTDTLTWLDRLHAARAYAGPGSVISGAAALADIGLRTVSRPAQILVLARRDVTSTSRQFVRIRRTHRLPVPILGSRPARAPHARAVADLALERPRLDDVRALVAQAVRAGLCTRDELRAELVAGPRRHSANLRLAIEDIAGGAWSAPEAEAIAILRRAKVPPFEPNKRIDLPDGGYVVVDALWEELRAVLEIDSREHHFENPEDEDATEDKHLALESLGYSVAHYPPARIKRNPRAFQTAIERWLAARARHVG